MLRIIITFALLLFIVAPQILFADGTTADPLAFKEIWAYVMAEDQDLVLSTLPITDVACFSAGINSKGELFGALAFSKPLKTKARRHLVVAQLSNEALLHFVLSPEYPLRDKLIKDLVNRSRDFDGIQIDFETIASFDKANFRQFLTLLKTQMGTKILSVALPARARTYDDAFEYTAISAIVDRIIVMAYDESWSGSKPGSIASLAWCSAVANYALKNINPDKLVMGMPFYGRVWGDKNPAGAYRFASMERLQKENAVNMQRDAEGIPFFNFTTTINYTAYYEDPSSIIQRATLYRKATIEKIGFWRLGQEAPAVWGMLNIAIQSLATSTPLPTPPPSAGLRP